MHHRPEIFKGQLDFGTMGVEERRNMTFTLRNDNPIDVSVGWRVDVVGTLNWKKRDRITTFICLKHICDTYVRNL